jgi:hypothetical protein
MTLYNTGRILSGTAASATTAGTFYKKAAGDLVTPASVEGERCDGVFVDSVDAGEPVGLYQPGGGAIVPMLAGGALDELDLVMADYAGKALDGTGAAAGKWMLGQVVRGSSAVAEDDEVAIQLFDVPQQKVTA